MDVVYSSDKQCLVCSDTVSGVHFGILSCRACAAFFRRTMKYGLQYTCRKNNNCQILAKERNSCRACRLTKCYNAGMINTRETASDGCPTPPPSFQHVERSVFQPVKGCSLTEISKPVTDNSRMLEDLTVINQRIKQTVRELFNAEHLLTINNDIPLNICQQAMIAFNQYREGYPKLDKSMLKEDYKLDLSKIVSSRSKEVEELVRFCMGIDAFRNIQSNSDRWQLIKNFWKSFIEMNMIFTTLQILGPDNKDGRVVVKDGGVLDMIKVDYLYELNIFKNVDEKSRKSLFGEGRRYYVELFLKPFKIINPDKLEFMYILMVCLFNVPGNITLSETTREIAKEVLERLPDELHFYYLYQKRQSNYVHRVMKIAQMLTNIEKLTEGRKEKRQMSQLFDLIRPEMRILFELDDFDELRS